MKTLLDELGEIPKNIDYSAKFQIQMILVIKHWCSEMVIGDIRKLTVNRIITKLNKNKVDNSNESCIIHE